MPNHILLTKGSLGQKQAVFTSALYAPTPGLALIACVYNERCPAPPNAGDLSGNGLIWFQKGSGLLPGRPQRLSVYHGYGTAVPGALTIDFHKKLQDGCEWVVWQVTEVSQIDPIVRAVFEKQQAGSSPFTITMPDFKHANNPTVGIFGYKGATALGAGAGFTALAEQTLADPVMRLLVEYQNANDTSVTATGQTAQNWGGFGLELRYEGITDFAPPPVVPPPPPTPEPNPPIPVDVATQTQLTVDLPIPEVAPPANPPNIPTDVAVQTQMTIDLPIPSPPPTPPPVTTYQGYGSLATGGAGQSTVHVTNLSDSGAGSLRTALASGNRTIVFDVTGTINLNSRIKIVGFSNITIEGIPGIVVSKYGIQFQGCTNVIIRNLCVRHLIQHDNTSTVETCLMVSASSSNFIIDHCSLGEGDDTNGVEVGNSSRDVTISWCIIAGRADFVHNHMARSDKFAKRISFHHNLEYKGTDRQPKVGWDNTFLTSPDDLVWDIRNNLIWDYKGAGSGAGVAIQMQDNGTANLVNNYFYSSTTNDGDDAVSIQGASNPRVYASGNYSKNGVDVDGRSTEGSAFSVPSYAAVTTGGAQAQAAVIIGASGAGVRPLDAFDSALIAVINSVGL